MSRKSLRQSEVKDLASELASLGTDQGALVSKAKVEVLVIDGGEITFVEGVPNFARKQSRILPSLKNSNLLGTLPHIIVDMGAVSHVCNGADIMARGVTRIEGEFDKEALVVVVDERHHKPLAVGSAMMDSASMRQAKSGKVVQNEHYIGDELWEAMKDTK